MIYAYRYVEHVTVIGNEVICAGIFRAPVFLLGGVMVPESEVETGKLWCVPRAFIPGIYGCI